MEHIFGDGLRYFNALSKDVKDAININVFIQKLINSYLH